MFKTLLPMAALTLGLAIAPLRASEWNHQTTITLNLPMNVQGTVLEPGQYVMKLLDDNAGRSTVLIYDRDGQHLIATVLGMPAYRVEPTDDTSFAFYEKSADQPAALRTWFYPGEYYGLEFNDKPVTDVSHR
jgi:hypothetical protein